MSVERRLDQLEVIYRRAERRPRPSPDWDPSALSSEEMIELFDLLEEPERYQRRTGLVSYAMLTAEQRARIEALWSRVLRVA
jgi:hypothetical protein